MDKEESDHNLGRDLPAGARHYRAFVGPPDKYDLVSAMQFNLLTLFGLRENHYLLDIGCGSLRAGRLLLTYLLPKRYYCIEPEQWLVEEGIRNELGEEIVKKKEPTFDFNRTFTFSSFGLEFDYLLAQSIFSHASDEQIKRCLSEAKKVMKDSSIFLATFMEGKENYKGKDWIYPDCATYTLTYFKKIVKEQGLNINLINWSHPNNQTWVAILKKGHNLTISEEEQIFKYILKKEKKVSQLGQRLRNYITKAG